MPDTPSRSTTLDDDDTYSTPSPTEYPHPSTSSSSQPPHSSPKMAELLDQLRQMDPSLCRQGLLNRFEELADLLAAGWKYHVANTEGIKEAWARFEDFYESVCAYTEGEKRQMQKILQNPLIEIKNRKKTYANIYLGESTRENC